MKVGILGLGRMGQAIQGILNDRKDIQAEPFSRLTAGELARLRQCDVVIDFTTPEAAPGIIRTCLENGIKVVSGTTGWYEYHLENLTQFCHEKNGHFLYASNFSIGMNVVFALNAKLASVMKRYPAFTPALKEIHHIHKKDIPSGTAWHLLEGILKNNNQYSGFQLNPEQDHLADDQVPVTAIREGEVKGFHEVTWESAGERIFIGHEAKDRSIFAQGAITAAEWLVHQQPNVYTMKDIISL